MVRSLAVLGVLWCVLLSAARVASAAEELEFHSPAAADGAATAAAMRSLAMRAIPVYENPSREQFLTNLSALQMVAGEYAAANTTRESLHELREQRRTARDIDEAMIYDLYARARAVAAKSRMPFDQAFARVFHEEVSPLGDRNAYTLAEWLATPLSIFRGNLQRELDRLRGKDRISLSEAIDLAWTYLSFEAFQSFGPLVGPLVADDDRARYFIDDHVSVSSPGHAALSAVVVRPRKPAAALPALLEFASAADAHEDAKECASYGYAGVVAYEPNEDEASAGPLEAGEEARAVIEWIAAQSWSDGRVGMYGSGYGAFVAWAAAKQPPPALKALAASSAVAPGIEAPNDDRGEGLPAAFYRTWLEHPSFDRSWQKVMPYRADFAHIDVPVLATTGYYDPDQAGSLYYFTEHARYDPRADQTLLIGPYDGHAMQGGPLPVLGGYTIDEAAIIDLHDLRFRWFDHVLKGAAAPDLLSERVNFEVMGANAWRHAASVDAMANGTVRLYLDGTRVGNHYRLTGHEPPRTRLIEEPVSTTSPVGASRVIIGIMARALPPGGAVFVSGPLHRPLEVSGRVSAQLALASSGRGVTFGLRIYELRASGEYLQLFAPSAELCAGCADRLGPRKLQLRSDVLTSAELATGSRIVVVIDASSSALRGPALRGPALRSRSAKAAPPSVIKWSGGSFIELPVRR